MRKRLVSILLSVMMLTAVTTLAAADSEIVNSMDFQGEGIELSLEKVVNIAMTENPVIMKSEMDVEQAKLDYDKGKRALTQLRKVINTRDKESLEYLENYAPLELSTEFNMKNAERTHEAVIEGVKADIEHSYYSLLQAAQLKKINEENLAIAKDLYESAKKKYELGLISKQDLLNSELNCIEAENQLKSALNSYKSAKMAMNIKLSRDVMDELVLAEDLSLKKYEPPEVAEAVKSALNNRKEIKALEFACSVAEVNKKVAEMKFPGITYQYRKAFIDYRKAAKDLEEGRKNIEVEVRINYMNLLQKQDEVTAGEKTAALEGEAFRIAQATYDAGMALPTDVQKARVALQQAKLGLSGAILDFNLAALKLEDSLGVGRVEASGW